MVDVAAGLRLGGAIVVSEVERYASGNRRWVCRCDCGHDYFANHGNIRRGLSSQCRSCSKSSVVAGAVFNGWIAVSKSGTHKTHSVWLLRCACGAERHVSTGALNKGIGRCSCSRPKPKKHHPLYAVWCGMKQRCGCRTNPKWAAYGGRGISVCERWLTSFDAFVSDVGSRPSPRHSLDRIDPNGNYEPGNVRWATALEQSANQRRDYRRVAAVLDAAELEVLNDTSITALDMIARLRATLLGT